MDAANTGSVPELAGPCPCPCPCPYPGCSLAAEPKVEIQRQLSATLVDHTPTLRLNSSVASLSQKRVCCLAPQCESGSSPSLLDSSSGSSRLLLVVNLPRQLAPRRSLTPSLSQGRQISKQIHAAAALKPSAVNRITSIDSRSPRRSGRSVLSFPFLSDILKHTVSTIGHQLTVHC